MEQVITLSIHPHELDDLKAIRQKVSRQLKIADTRITGFEVLRKSIDARKSPVYVLKLRVVIDEPEISISQQITIDYPKLATNCEEVIIIGAGPAGLFAALQLIELGIKPIIFERGKDVRSRRRDLAQLNKKHLVNPESNYCFGEGGAGTYSDGKLYTRSTKRGDVKKILHILHQFGAPKEILINAHPHIGTNKLPQIIVAIRELIISKGGEVHFESKLTDILIKNNRICGIEINKKQTYPAKNIILASGHSARDVYELLHTKNIAIEAKPFAMGVRVEHPQSLIDQLQYKCETRSEYLPPASYSLVHNVNGRGVFSFCMCPGGVIAPCATSPSEIVTNGWSPSKRNIPYANSGMVVSVYPQDAYAEFGEQPLAGLQLQQHIEHKAWQYAGKTQAAPAQNLIDFLEKRKSRDLPDCSYQPGVVSVNLWDILPAYIAKPLAIGLKHFGKKMPTYLHSKAILVAPESRTSAPVRIPRDKQTLMHIEITGLYPCAEGAGYAGGIVSAAIDGENCAKAIAKTYSIKA